jgi:uncharacterized protein YdhG (YjbR/CyaY superfamily)
MKRTSFERYLAALPPKQRTALQKLRKAIHAAVTGLEECISYGVPAFRLNGRFLVAMGAASNHCSFYPGSAVQVLKIDLKGYDVAKGTVRFTPDNPLPASLVRKLVKARMAKGGFV